MSQNHSRPWWIEHVCMLQQPCQQLIADSRPQVQLVTEPAEAGPCLRT